MGAIDRGLRSITRPANPGAAAIGLIGNTPLVEVTRMDAGLCRLFVKLEGGNPGGSIKDRPALTMVEALEKQGLLAPGGTLVEATAGNTGLGLAVVAVAKNYRLILVIPDKMSREKIFHLRAMGAEVVMTRSDVGKGHPEYYQDMAERIAANTPGAVYVNQFANPANPLAHERGTAPEIWRQMDGDVDAVVCAAGSCGIVTGISRFFAVASPSTDIVLADPVGSILVDVVQGRQPGPVGSWLVEGIGKDFVPPVADLSRVTHAYAVSDGESFAAARALLRREGLLVGSSSGTILAAALRYCREQTTSRRVVALSPDSGSKYLSKMFNDYWMIDQGFIKRPRTGDLRDLVARRHDQGATVVVAPDDTLTIAWSRMRLYDVSQLPVLEGDRPVGMIDESDLLLAVSNDPARFIAPVWSAMNAALKTVSVDATIADLLALFAQDLVAVVMDHGQFIGLITRTDVIDYLRGTIDRA